MWHRVGAIGTQAEQEEISALMRYAATLHHVAGGGWEIRDGEEILARLTPASAWSLEILLSTLQRVALVTIVSGTRGR